MITKEYLEQFLIPEHPPKPKTPREKLEEALDGEKANSPVIMALMDVTLLQSTTVNTAEHTKVYNRMERRKKSKEGAIYDHARAERYYYLGAYYPTGPDWEKKKKEAYQQIIFDLTEINEGKKKKKGVQSEGYGNR
jgi:hypothetical protein